MAQVDDFGAALTRELEAKHWSPEKLCAETGIPPEMLRMHLAGLHRPNDRRIERIELALGLDTGTLANIPLPSPEMRRPGRL